MASDAAVLNQDGHPSYLVNTGKHKGIKAWILSTDHKRIGILYLIALLSFLRLELRSGF